MKYTGNLIYVDDLRLGGIYLQDSTVVTKDEALTATGTLKLGYIKLESACGVEVYASDMDIRNKFKIAHKVNDAWFHRSSTAPYDLQALPDGPVCWGYVITVHLNHRSYEVYGEDEVNVVYFIE